MKERKKDGREGAKNKNVCLLFSIGVGMRNALTGFCKRRFEKRAVCFWEWWDY